MLDKKSTYQELENQIAELKEHNEFLFSNAKSDSSKIEGHYKFLHEQSLKKERKHYEEALNQCEKKYREIFNSMDEMFHIIELIYDNNGKPIDYYYREVNPAFERLVGKTREQLVDKRAKDLFYVVENYWIEIFDKVAITGTSTNFENYGAELNKWYKIFAWKVAGNQVAIIFSDITEHKRDEMEITAAKKEIAEIEAQLYEAQKLAHIGSWVYDPLTQQSNWSDEMFRICGMDSKFGAPDYLEQKKLIHIDDWRIFDTAVGNAVKKGIPYNLELRISRPDGTEKTIITIGHAVLSDKGKVIGLKGTAQDITALKISENKLKALNLTLEDKVRERTEGLVHSLEREKNISDIKSKFVSMASHEFRTPLTVINTSTSLIKKYTETEQQNNRDKHLDRISSAVKHLTQILNDFLTLGKIEDGKLGTKKSLTNIKELTLSLVGAIEGTAKKGQVINYTHKGDTDFLIDDNLFRGVVLNLLSNAIKYSEKDIEIKTRVLKRNLVISVKDNGIGIPVEDQKLIFSRFFRASNARGIHGTGLGLNIVQQYVRLLNGTIDFKSIQGKGTTFKVHCPS